MDTKLIKSTSHKQPCNEGGLEDDWNGEHVKWGAGQFPQKKKICQQKRRATELANSKKCPLECNFPHVEMIK